MVERAVAKVIVNIVLAYILLDEVSLLALHLQEVIVQVQPGDRWSFFGL